MSNFVNSKFYRWNRLPNKGGPDNDKLKLEPILKQNNAPYAIPGKYESRSGQTTRSTASALIEDKNGRKKESRPAYATTASMNNADVYGGVKTVAVKPKAKRLGLFQGM